uniref:Uncharacterized protein n=1 Tax=Tetranychus urticae TaxID=32264 RepID=T1K4N6_TETUR
MVQRQGKMKKQKFGSKVIPFLKTGKKGTKDL